MLSVLAVVVSLVLLMWLAYRGVTVLLLAPLMAAVAFLITLIPLVGSVLFWVIGSVIALFSDPWHALFFAIIYLVYMQVEAYFLTPRVMNKAVSVPGALVVIGAPALVAVLRGRAVAQ